MLVNSKQILFEDSHKDYI